MNTFRLRIYHGRIGNIKVSSEWNADREKPSRQVWVSRVTKKGKEMNTSSGNLVTDRGAVDSDERYGSYKLTSEELAFVEKIYEEYEGAIV